MCYTHKYNAHFSMPRKTKGKKIKESEKEAVEVVIKSGLGIHWYCLLWLIAITILLSTVIMVYASWSFSQRAPEMRSAKTEHLFDQRLEGMERRMNLMEASLQNIERLMEEDAQQKAKEAKKPEAVPVE